jgi:hypothetical protein
LTSDQDPALPLEISVDGAPFTAYAGTVALSSDGVHTVQGRDERGASGAALVRIDATAPDLATSVTPVPDAAGWSDGPVTVAMSASDGAGAGITSLTYSATGAQAEQERTVAGSAATLDVTAEGVTQVSVTATDGAGRTTTGTVTVRIDRTPPTVSATPSPPANAAGWWNGPVAIAFAGDDADGSGIASLTYSATGAQPVDPQTVAGGSASLVVTTEGTTAVTVIATDLAGRTTSTTLTVKLDIGPPVIAIRSPAEGSALAIGQSLVADYSCTDALSGLVSCEGPVPVGAPVDTSAPGAQTFAVTATDAAGNSATCSVTYGVLYRVCVLKGDEDESGHLGSTIPIKLRLCTASGANVSSPSIVLTATAVDAGPPLPNDSGSANPGLLFRYTGGAYTYNLKTGSIPPTVDGRHTMSFVVGSDPAVYTVSFSVRP